jgi:hypothetical protein
LANIETVPAATGAPTLKKKSANWSGMLIAGIVKLLGKLKYQGLYNGDP